MTQDPRLGSYSKWLRDNQDKRDTPEWQKVSNAYKSIRTNAAPQPQSQQQQAVNPDGTGVGRMLEKGARSVYTGGKQFQANILSEKSFQKTQPNSEYLRRAMMLRGAQIPPDMDPDNIDVERLMEFNVFDLGKGTKWRDDVYKFAGVAVKSSDEYFKSGEEAKDFSKLNDLSQEIASQNQKMRDLVNSPSAQNAADRWEAAPDVKSALKSLTVNPLESIAFFGELAAESIPSIAAGSLATLITGNPTVGAGVMVFSGAPRSYNAEVNDFLTENGVDTTDPQSVSDALDNRELMGKANSRGLTKAAIVSGFEALGMKAGGGILKQSAAQGITGGAGEGVSTQVLDGEVDWKDVWLEALAELATAPAEATILRSKKGKAKKATKEERVLNNAAAASLAQRLRTLSQNNNYNLKDVKKDGGAKEALEAAHGKITQDMKTIVTNPAVKGYLDPKQAESIEELIDKYSSAQTAVRQVRNKVKDKVTVENAEAILKLLPAGKERDQIANLMRESNVLTDLFRSGTKGGISSFTDTFNPFAKEDGSYDPSRMISAGLNKGTAILSAGASLPTQLGIVAGGRTIDAVTRRRAAIDRFVRKNEGKTPLKDPTGPSLVAAEAERQAQAEQLKFDDEQRALELGRLAQSDKDNSPVGTVLLGTGLDRDGLRAAMSELENMNPDTKALKDVFTDIRKNMDGGTNKIRNLNDIIPIINHHLNTPDTTVQRQANPDQLLAQRGGVNMPPNVDQNPPPAPPQAQTEAPLDLAQFAVDQNPPAQPRTENYQAGKDDNNTFVRNLESKLADDTTLAPLDKAQLATVLADMQLSLGPNPVEAMTEMVEDLGNMGVPQEAIDTYVKPYADRVVKQQDRAAASRLEAPVEPEVAPEAQQQSPLQQAQELTKLSDSAPLSEKLKALTAETRANELKDDLYSKAVRVVVEDGKVAPSYLQRKLGIGLNKAAELVNQMEQEGFISPADQVGRREVDPELAKERLDKLEAPVDPETDPDIRAAMRPQEDAPSGPALSTPEIPRGETTNIQMPNSLGPTFKYAKNTTFAKGRDLKIALQEKALAAQKEEGIDLTDLSDANISRLADYVLGDALEALKDNQNAIGWYDRTVTDALSSLGEIYPEIQTNPMNKLQFIWALAVTSNGTKVDKNFELAADAYDHLQRTGRFPTNIGIGEAAKAINGGLKQYHTMLEKFERKTNTDEGDHQLLADFMTSQVPVRVIEDEYDVDISGEGKGTLVRGASILGPKIGNGFFSNLYGHFDALTMDRWLMRSVGRWRGSLIKMNPAMEKKKRSEIKSMITDMSSDNVKSLRRLMKPSGIKIGKTMSNQNMNDLAAYVAKQSTSKDWREGLNQISPEFRKSANSLAKYLDGQVEAPAGAKERDFIRSVFTQALGRLNAEPAVTRASNTGLTMSDLQALLWYPEKRLYDTAKAKEGQESRGYADDEAPDYANAARKLVEARKTMAVGSGLGSTGADGSGGRGPIGSDARPPRQSIPPATDGVAGILAQRITGGPTQRAAVPSSQEVKQATPPVRAIIEVGKKGSKFENGIKDIQGVRQLADAINVTLKMYNSQIQMAYEAGDPKQADALGLYVGGTARAMNPQNINEDNRNADPFGLNTGNLGPYISNFQSYISALHEVAHGLNDQRYNPNYIDRFSDPEVRERLRGKIGNSWTSQNALTGRQDQFTRHSFDDMISSLINNTVSFPANQRKQVLAEIKKMQDQGKYENDSDIRYEGGAKRSVAKRRSTPYYKYIRSAPEMAVDPVINYLHNPKQMKTDYPATAELIKTFFKDSTKIQFFSHPLAMAIAVTLAMIMKQEQAEDEERQQQMQMPAGALNQPMPQGMLSA